MRSLLKRLLGRGSDRGLRYNNVQGIAIRNCIIERVGRQTIIHLAEGQRGEVAYNLILGSEGTVIESTTAERGITTDAPLVVMTKSKGPIGAAR